MIFRSTQPRRRVRKGLSAAVTAIALASGGLVAGTVASTPALAQSRPSYSQDFVKAYQPVQDIFNAAQDAAAAEAARPLVQPMIDAVSNNDDRFAAGALLIQLGLKISEPSYQRSGIVLQLDSGKVPADRLALFNYYAGSFAWDAKEYPAARQYLSKAYELGHRTDNLERLIAETYFVQGQTNEGLAVLDGMIAERGSAIVEDTYRRALQVVVDARMGDQIARRSVDLLRYHPSPTTWNTALRVVKEAYDFTADEVVDLFRLMKLTGALADGRLYVEYIEAADARRMANEVLPLIEEAVGKGLLNADDVFVREAREVAVVRAQEDRDAADDDAASARRANDAVSARAAADNFFAIGNFAGAEEFYRLALQRAPEDADRLNMRIGLSQARQGKLDEARSTFQAVKGNRATVASMWLAWLDQQQGG